MADDESINFWLRVRDRRRFSRELRAAKRDVRQLGDETERANNKQKLWNAALEKLSGILGGGGSRSVFGRTRIWGFAIGTVITALVAVIPLVTGLGGALASLTASLGVAALGLGGLGVALGAVAAVGFGGITLALAQAQTGFSKINDALTAYKIAVDQYGRASTQAATAMAHLNAVTKNFGGTPMLKAVVAWQALGNTFRRAIQPSLRQIGGLFYDLISVAKTAMPIFAAVTNQMTRAIVRQLRIALREVSGPLIRTFIALAPVFRQIIGPAVRTLTNLFIGLLSIARAFAPLLSAMFREIEKLSVVFRNWAATIDTATIGEHFLAWWVTLKEFGKLLINLFRVAAPEGKQLVFWIGSVIARWNQFLESTRGKNELAGFFHSAANMSKAFFRLMGLVVKILFRFGEALQPLYTKIFNGIVDTWGRVMEALKPAKPFLDNILIPLIKGLATGVGSGLKGALNLAIGVLNIFAKVLGFVGSKLAFLKGPIEIVGRVIGFFFSGAILKALAALGKLSILLKPLAMLFKLLYQPIRLVGTAFGWVFGKGRALVNFFGRLVGSIMPGVRSAFLTMLDFLKNLGGRFFNAGKFLWNKLVGGLKEAIGAGLGLALDIAKGVGNFLINLLNDALPNKISLPGPAPDINLPDNPIPKLAGGGIVSGEGSWVTGEAGPELNTLRGGRVHVQPLPAISTPAPGSATLDPAGGKRVLVSKVYLRGRQIAEAVADEIEDDIARA